MNHRIGQSQAARGAFVLLLLCVLAIRLVVPSGFMPTQSAQGVVIWLCTAQGAVKTVLPIERDDTPSGHENAADAPCVFAAGLGGGLLAPPPDPSLIPVAAWPAIAMPRRLADLTVHRLAAPPPPAHGPPAHRIGSRGAGWFPLVRR